MSVVRMLVTRIVCFPRLLPRFIEGSREQRQRIGGSTTKDTASAKLIVGSIYISACLQYMYLGRNATSFRQMGISHDWLDSPHSPTAAS